ncbi:hypothetical protein NIES2101_08455 [Calothrix sp. HK-06]|nr:hypothetical protein NIES2101_08455 [Calothrix sp. HK-06]
MNDLLQLAFAYLFKVQKILPEQTAYIVRNFHLKLEFRLNDRTQKKKIGGLIEHRPLFDRC